MRMGVCVHACVRGDGVGVAYCIFVMRETNAQTLIVSELVVARCPKKKEEGLWELQGAVNAVEAGNGRD